MAIIDNASTSSGGSSQWSRSTGTNSAWSYANTNGAAATQKAIASAYNANLQAKSNWETAAEFNAEQARIQREWQEYMANTVYQRSVADMKAAGINPILAASMGMGTGSVGSGAVASMSAPSTYMADTFADSNSASKSEGMSESYGEGSSWNKSESSLGNQLTLLGEFATTMLGNLASSKKAQEIMDKIDNFNPKTVANEISKEAEKTGEKAGIWLRKKAMGKK